MTTEAATPSTLVLACGALAKEIRTVLHQAGLSDVVALECLPAELHNRPSTIAGKLEERLRRAAGQYEHVLIGYMDCGSQGAIDELASRWGAERLAGPHCYSSYATAAVFERLHDAEPGTFYVTDYLLRFFDRWVIRGLGLDRHPELREAYFGNYTRLLYLSQEPTAEGLGAAQVAADTLGLRLEHQHVGYGEIETALLQLQARAARGGRTDVVPAGKVSA